MIRRVSNTPACSCKQGDCPKGGANYNGSSRNKNHVAAYRLALADLLFRLQDYSAARDQLRPLLSDKRLGAAPRSKSPGRSCGIIVRLKQRHSLMPISAN